ncbi:NuoF family protein [Pseudanabaena mucicola]|uniref:SLBB domain-containing protein n=1 Tax=Pseudanabaena mucicola FACHB-723 TaxID=2692860 RepID=A0ABR7ZZ42_9CYAN|nr:NuoF family protein [Pseudanabaena mucicola]MBD2189233.1 SLBB domain-containing protein [Pseudanabaena mucicola FACHB-723]
MDIEGLLQIAKEERDRQKSIRIRCCTSGGCQASGSLAVRDRLEAAINAEGLADTAEVVSVGCMGFCGRGPLVAIDSALVLYEQVRDDQAASIVSGLKGGNVTATVGDLEHPFFKQQLRIVLEHIGQIDPTRIEPYIAVGGYRQLYRTLHEMTPQQVIDEVTRSGLRGRGGAGYPTGLKWATVAKMQDRRRSQSQNPNQPQQKYVICNADEGDPGAFMDRSILESDPHRVLEGMAIAAYAVGATHGYVYVRAEYPPAIEHIRLAIQQAKQQGILGSQIFESTFDFKIDVRVGAGAYVCGEETALIASIEGGRGIPHPRPPYPAESGLWGAPTLINNVETFANIVPIIRNRGAWYASIGTEKSKGTKVFSLAGNIANTGLVEVPMGIPLRQIVEDMGGGTASGGKVKAVQTGGPSGGCIPASAFDTPIDYEAMQALGSIIGSGGMVVMDENTNMVDMARFFIQFCMDESCGKCVPCRAGTVQLHQLLSKFIDRNATEADLASLEELCGMVKSMSLCGLGQSAPNPIVSTLRHFRDDYLQLIKEVKS